MLTTTEQTKLTNLQAKDQTTLSDKERGDLRKLIAKSAEQPQSEKIAEIAEHPTSEKVEKSSDEIAALSIEDRTKYFEGRGYKKERLDIYGNPSNLPEIGTITSIKEVVYEIEQSDKSIQTSNGLRIIATDAAGKTFECSLSRASVRSIQKTATKTGLDMSELKLDKNDDVRIVGENLSDIPNHPVLIYDYIGKKFKSEKIQVFVLPFNKRFKSKHEALENLTVQSAFKVTLLD